MTLKGRDESLRVTSLSGVLQAPTTVGTISILQKGEKAASSIDVDEVTAIGTLSKCPGE